MSPRREAKTAGKGVNERSGQRDAEAAEQSLLSAAPQEPDPNPQSQNKRNRPPGKGSSTSKRRKPTSSESLTGDVSQRKGGPIKRSGLAPFNNDLYKNSDALMNAAKVGELNFANYLEDCKEDGILQSIPSLKSLFTRLKNKYKGLTNCPEHTIEFLEAHFNRAYTWYRIANGYASTEDLAREARRYWKKSVKESLRIIRDNLPEGTVTIKKADKDGALAGIVEDLEKCHLLLLKLGDGPAKEDVFFANESPLHGLLRIRDDLAAIYTEEMKSVALDGVSKLNLVFSASSPEDIRAECFTQLEARSALLIGSPGGAENPGSAWTANKRWAEIPPFRHDVYSPQNLSNIRRAAKIGSVDYDKHCQVWQLVGGKKKVSNVHGAIRALIRKYKGCEGCLEEAVDWVEISAKHFKRLSRATVDIQNYEQKSLQGRYSDTKQRLCNDLQSSIESFKAAQEHGETYVNVTEVYQTVYDAVKHLQAGSPSERFLPILEKVYEVRGSLVEAYQLLLNSANQTDEVLKSRISLLRGEDKGD